MTESRLHIDAPPFQRRFTSVLRSESRQRLQTDERRSKLALCRDSFHQYLMNSSLHGLKYVGDRMITRFERYANLSLLNPP